MGRNRVLSFMSQFSGGAKTPSPSSSPPNERAGLHLKQQHQTTGPFPDHTQLDDVRRPATPPSRPDYGSPLNGSPRDSPPQQRQRSSSRPLSMVQTYQPPVMDINEDTIPELQPIFTLLNSHSNKLYQEGYFLKLDDQNTQGKPNADRTWSECFAQLVGTVLSLWDAAELDLAGEDGEVLPKFINLTDASIKMIESLPTRSNDEQPLQNILSISTAGRNRYLLHFNSHHSLIQWTAGIRLAMYEHSTLQEAYTGALIAGKGKSLNNINVVMERTRLKSEQWVRVRFGAGVPWRRCWCVITPPDEKEYQKMQKELKKRSAYDRSAVPTLKGDVRFYDTRKDGKKQKKAQPIATITDAYSAYAIYPQAKSLIDMSTLLKIEGNVTVHSDPPSATEGFIFVMPEVHPAVSGFEMLLRFLFPTWDTFALYGRPGRLVASTLDPRSLMFAMPKNKRYGYLEILDISNLILEDRSSTWAEREWRKRLKDATGTRMNAMEDDSRSHSRAGSRSSARLSFGGGVGAGGKPKVGFTDGNNLAANEPRHMRNVSDPNLGSAQRNDYGPPGGSPQRQQLPLRGGPPPGPGETGSSDEELGVAPPPPMHNMEAMRNMQTPEPVSRPPAFNHGTQDRSTAKAYHSPELRRANSRLSTGTLAQLATAGGMGNVNGPNANQQRRDYEDGLNPTGPNGNLNLPAQDNSSQRSRSPGGLGPPGPYLQNPSSSSRSSSRPGTSEGRRSPYPPGQQGQPPRSPNPQQTSFRPEQTRAPPGGMPGGPPGGPMGAPGPYGGRGRGRPPPPGAPGHRPPPPNGPPDQYGNYRPGPGGPPPPGGRGAPPQNVHPHRKPLPRQTNSITPNDIIDHYTSDPYRGGPPPPGRGPAAPPYQQGPRYGGMNGPNDGEDRPRAGVMKTVGGAEPPVQRPGGFDIPEVNFGPTINYGASAVPSQQAQGPAEHNVPGQQQGYNYSSEQSRYGPGPGSGHGSGPPPPDQARQETVDSQKRTMAWQPGGSYAGSAPVAGQRALTPEQYVQHRAGAGPPPGYGSGPGGRQPSPQPPYPGPGAGPPPPQHGSPGPGNSFSRPLRAGSESPSLPPQGQYGAGHAQNTPYQGQAF